VVLSLDGHPSRQRRRDHGRLRPVVRILKGVSGARPTNPSGRTDKVRIRAARSRSPACRAKQTSYRRPSRCTRACPICRCRSYRGYSSHLLRDHVWTLGAPRQAASRRRHPPWRPACARPATWQRAAAGSAHVEAFHGLRVDDGQLRLPPAQRATTLPASGAPNGAPDVAAPTSLPSVRPARQFSVSPQERMGTRG
jgi:hypothetical protein